MSLDIARFTNEKRIHKIESELLEKIRIKTNADILYVKRFSDYWAVTWWYTFSVIEHVEKIPIRFNKSQPVSYLNRIGLWIGQTFNTSFGGGSIHD